MSAAEVDVIVSDLMANLVDRVKPQLQRAEGLLLMVAPEEVGALSLALAAWAMSVAGPWWLPEVGRPCPEAMATLPVKDRLTLALMAARASESKEFVREVRADMAALRRMGRV